MHISFLGAAGTVTGSKYLVKAGNRKILLDCGLFQGYKQLRLRNWAPLPVAVKDIDAVILTHAHLDHSGYLPLLVKNGFTGPIYCTEATRDLCAILLPDSGFLQEEDAAYANRHGFSKHDPALPLYTVEDAKRALLQFKPVAFEHDFELGNLSIRFLPAGHILGAALVMLRHAGTSILFSGDLGRPNDLLMKPPTAVSQADYVVVESTYGDKRHDAGDPAELLAEIFTRTFARGGAVIIPAFAVGRAQLLLYYVHLLKASGKLPNVPVYLNSPMAVNVTKIFHRYRGEHRLTAEQCDAMCATAEYVNSAEESKALNARLGRPMIIISASGMATGGRVIHHLKAFAPDWRNTILFTGFQAGGTRGAALLDGAREIKIHGEYIPVRAEVANISNISAHADYMETLDWLGHLQAPPRRVFITHGEPTSADALRQRIEEQFGWNVHVPENGEQVELP
jgi:metallo-beta-lactamase family protein